MNRPIAPEVVEAELARLPDMSLDELKARWLEFKGVPLPKFMRRGLITRSVAHAIHERSPSTAGNRARRGSIRTSTRSTRSREAGEAYVASQKHEGWQTIPTLYDDGGYSGGRMERPRLRKLTADVGLIETVAVYKVDRLTRAVSDLAKIVETSDRHGVSFVSLTQAFNTTTGMGRLTLNVLLSFALLTSRREAPI